MKLLEKRKGAAQGPHKGSPYRHPSILPPASPTPYSRRRRWLMRLAALRQDNKSMRKWATRTVGMVILFLIVWSSSAASQQIVLKSKITPTKTSILKRLRPTAVVPTSTPVPTFQIQALYAAYPQVEQGDWATYGMNDGRTGFNRAEFMINASTAPALKQLWRFHGNSAISTQPVEFNELLYWGSWDGYEHATTLNGKQVWATNVGTTTDYICNPPSAGVASTATIAPVKIGQAITPVVFVGGGNADFYALNASNGRVIWRVSLGYSPASFIWSSPIVYKGSVYIGLASFGDCPTIQGQLIQMNASNGAIQNIFYVVPGGCRGGSVWGSPSIDDATGDLFFATGNPDPCWTKEHFVTSVIKVRASDLSYVDSWQVPSSQAVLDSDFGSTPTLFTARVGGDTRPLLGVGHKNGLYYVFDRRNIGAGPIWVDRVAYGGSDPQYGAGSISPSAWDGTRLYVAGGNTTINGTFCSGSVRAVDPGTGNYIWEHCLFHGPVLAAVTVVPGVVVVEEGSAFDVLDAQTGRTLFTYKDNNAYSWFPGASTISNGVLYLGNYDGNLYAFGLISKRLKKPPV